MENLKLVVDNDETKSVLSGVEAMLAIRERMKGYDLHILAAATSRSYQCMRAIEKGKTQWPRPNTLFPLLRAIGYEMHLVTATPATKR